MVTAWSPHWMFSRWPMHYLDDPLGSLGNEESIFKVGRIGLKKDYPDAWAFLSNFHYDDASQLQRLMDWNQQRGTDPVQNARRFMSRSSARRLRVSRWSCSFLPLPRAISTLILPRLK